MTHPPQLLIHHRAPRRWWCVSIGIRSRGGGGDGGGDTFDKQFRYTHELHSKCKVGAAAGRSEAGVGLAARRPLETVAWPAAIARNRFVCARARARSFAQGYVWGFVQTNFEEFPFGIHVNQQKVNNKQRPAIAIETGVCVCARGYRLVARTLQVIRQRLLTTHTQHVCTHARSPAKKRKTGLPSFAHHLAARSVRCCASPDRFLCGRRLCRFRASPAIYALGWLTGWPATAIKETAPKNGNTNCGDQSNAPTNKPKQKNTLRQTTEPTSNSAEPASSSI